MTRRLMILLSLVASAFMLTACGGGGAKGDEKSAFEQLEAMPAEIDAQMASVTEPIDMLDTMLEQIKGAPEKYKLSKDDFSKLLTDSFAGKPFQAPANVDEKAAQELQDMLTKVGGFKDSLMAAPGRAADMVTEIPGMAAKVTKLATQVTADAKIVKANPLASKEDKAAAEKQEKDVETVKGAALGKIEEAKGKVTGVPARATEAVAKFTAAMGDMGITAAALSAATEKVDDAKAAGEGMKDAVKENAKESAEAVTN